MAAVSASTREDQVRRYVELDACARLFRQIRSGVPSLDMEAALLMDRLWPDDDDLEGDEFKSASRGSVQLEAALARRLLSGEGRAFFRTRLQQLLERAEATTTGR